MKFDAFDEECAEVTSRKNEAYIERQVRRTSRTVEQYQEKRREEKHTHKRKKKD